RSIYAADARRIIDDYRRRDDWAWDSARRRDEVREYERYLRDFPDGYHRYDAERRVYRLQADDRQAWDRAVGRDTIDAYEYYLATQHDGEFRDRAHRRIRTLRDAQS